MKRPHIILFALGLLLLSACDLPHQPGPMPSDIVETEFEPGLNIMGIIRADGLTGSSFVNINRALTTEEIYSDSIENFTPAVDAILISDLASGDESGFTLLDSNDLDTFSDSSFQADYGKHYSLEITSPDFPTLTADTQVPFRPVVSAMDLESNRLQFTVDSDPTAFELKVYLLFMDRVLEKVVKPVNGTDSEVHFSWDDDLQPLYLMVVAQDENLTRYANSPISFLPNTYHADPSTVEGGFGCFGSVAVEVIEL